jgi:hypothetical protein
MYCVNCGNPNQRPEAYCTRCGKWLTNSTDKDKRAPSPEERRQTLLAFSGINSVMALIAAILLYANHLGKSDAHWSVYVAAALCCAISIHQAISFCYNWHLQARLKQARQDTPVPGQIAASPGPPALPPAQPLPFATPAQSVTENTTELLTPVDRWQRQKQATGAGTRKTDL